MGPLRVRWLGRVPYNDALALQRALFTNGHEQHLLLLEHPSVYTLGVRADPSNVLVDPASVGAELVTADRGGDVTFHGPGQLVGYPIVSLESKRRGSGPDGPGASPVSGMADTVAYVRSVEQLIIDSLAELGLPNAGRLRDYPGVWLDVDGDNPRKIAAIGVKLSRGRTMHGFALNVSTDLAMFGHIVPCGIVGKAVTSMVEEGIDIHMATAVDVITRRAGDLWGGGAIDRADVVWRERAEDLSPFSRGAGAGDKIRVQTAGPSGADVADAGDAGADLSVAPLVPAGPSAHLERRLAQAGVSDGLTIGRKPDWMRVKLDTGPTYRKLRSQLRKLELTTVCEEAGCPNIFDCWNDGTATFMVLGERCTRACGFCLVDTRKPDAVDPDEPRRVAQAVSAMGLRHAVLTMVARDDLVDGGMALVAECVESIRRVSPTTAVETLVSDAKGDADSLALLFAVRPDVFNHNLETVARLQRAVRPSAGYARSLSVLGRAREAGLTTKSGLIVGMGESDDEIIGALADLAGVGVSIVTIGQYLRPTTHHLPVHRWVEPAQFDRYAAAGHELGIAHVEASPLTRSSYHARQAAEAGRAGEREATEVDRRLRVRPA